MLHAMKIETGVDLEALIDAAWLAEEIVGRPLDGRVKRTLPRHTDAERARDSSHVS